MKVKLIFLLSLFLLFPVTFANNQTNKTSYIPNQDYIIIELYGIGSMFTVWCEHMNEIDLLGGTALCSYDETQKMCNCKVRLPPDKSPSYFIGLEQMEARYDTKITNLENIINFWSVLFWICMFIILIGTFLFKVYTSSYKTFHKI